MEKKDCKILIIDDERELAGMVADILKNEGYSNVESAFSLKEANEKIKKGKVHLILLDVMLGDGNGFDFYERLKNEGIFPKLPVIFLSARDEDESRLHGLGLGADDYITKPFLPKELLLRIGAVIRRCYTIDENISEVVLGESLVSLDGGTVRKSGEDITLTAKELTLFSVLYRNRGRIVTTDILCEELWPDGSYGLENSLIVHMRHLREKIEKDPSKPVFLKTVRGLGYKLERA